MVIFDELRITNDGDNFIINARVRKEIYYKDVYIDSIIIDTEDTYKQSLPSDNSLFTKTFQENLKEVTLILNKYDLNTSLTNHLFFVYIKVKGTPKADTPCGMDNIYTLGVTMYMGDYYNTFMSYIKEMENNCSVPQGLIDHILRYKAVTTSIDSGHYPLGIKYYNKWFKGNNISITPTNNCGCHG